MTAELTKSANTNAAGGVKVKRVRGLRAKSGRVGRRRTDDVVVPRPDVDVDGVQNGEERKAPAYAVDDDLLSAVKELVDNRSEEE